MARKAKKVNPRPRADNPFVHVAFSAGDVFGVPPGGSAKREFCDTTGEYRAQLNQTVISAAEIVAANAERYPDIPTIVALRLRPEAIAKSHRPLALVHAADMPVVGHGALDEMLVEATPREMALLRTVVADRDSKVMRANLSAVSEVIAWDVRSKLPRELRRRSKPAMRRLLRQAERLWIRPFRYREDEVQTASLVVVERLLGEAGTEFQVLPQHKGPPIYVVDVDDALSDDLLADLLGFPGVRSIMPEPQAAAEPGPAAAADFAEGVLSPGPADDAPIVAVFDTGVHPAATMLAPWVVSTETFLTEFDTNYEHGTMVASLVADAHGLNEGHASFPITACRVHDVCGLESGVANVTDLILRLREAVSNRPDIRVWNLSLGGRIGVGDDAFSDFAQELDALSDQFNVLFVVAAGNYLDEPRRGWPCHDNFTDRISSPADSVRSLTVGAVTHEGSDFSYVAAGEPASYSRRGPGPVFTPKPDLVHMGGGCEIPWTAEGLGIRALAPDNSVIRSAGTSFAAPIVAAMAAQTWDALGSDDRDHGLSPSPMLVKALMIHSAELASPKRTPEDRRYYGAGVPMDPMTALYDSPESFTLVFDVDLTPGTKWRKDPYPIPDALMTDGKFRGEIIITAVYAPPLDREAGAEYVRANVEIGFGLLEPDEEDVLQFKGQVPMKWEEGADGLEMAQVEHGGKWAPVKVHRRAIQGVAGTHWGLQANMFLRSNEPVSAEPLRTTIVVTLRSIDGDESVYDHGIRALNASNWITQKLPVHVPINVDVR